MATVYPGEEVAACIYYTGEENPSQIQSHPVIITSNTFGHEFVNNWDGK